MTPEAALTKLSYVLGKTDWSTEKRRKVKHIFQYSLLNKPELYGSSSSVAGVHSKILEAPYPLSIQISSFSCSFWRNLDT